jgi:3-phosphoshikimate 1-carboxyvinyltransferase
MKITVRPSAINGIVVAPPSKSLTQRAIAAGLLASGTTLIRNPSFCNDSLSAVKMAEALGAIVSTVDDIITIQAGLNSASPVTLHCGESGLALRMFAPIAAALGPLTTFTGEGSLTRRPVGMIGEALSQLGVTVTTENGFLPLTISGKLSGGNAVIDGSTGSQLLTGLLMALPLLRYDSELTVHHLKSKPYISLTVQLLSDFGIKVENHDFKRFVIPGNQNYRAHEYTVEGDWSGAAFLLVAGAVGGEVTVTNLKSDSAQADRMVLDAFVRAGVKVTKQDNQVRAAKSDLKAFTFDATDSPDLFPPLAALSSYCRGISRIKGVGRLVHKESDRAKAIIQVLNEMHINAYIVEDSMFIEGGEVSGTGVSSHNDHRIVMMEAVMALGCRGEVGITGAEAVSKSYPEFFDALKGLGAEIT